jgi:Outer membrane protein beta-barrel domain
MKRALVVLLILAPLYGGNGDGKTEFRPSGFSVYAGPLWSKYTELPSVATIPEIHDALASYLGAVLGVSWQFPVGRHIVLEGGFQATQLGTTVKWYEFEEPSSKWVYSFITETALVELRIKPLRGSSPYALAGYDLSYLTRHDVLDYGVPNGPTRIYLKDDTKRFDMGVFAGGGLEIAFKKWMPFVEVRYNWGLLDISKGTGALESYPVIKTRALMVLAGVRFKFKRTGSGP